ncbi:MAG: hypothetical protein AABY87_13395 [bacterium]
MKKIALFLLALFVSNSWAGEFVFQDLDCKVLGPSQKKINVIEGDKSEYTCVVIGSEASCNYKNLSTQKLQGKPTKFEIIDLEGVQIWSSVESGNIKMIIDEKEKQFYYGMTAIIPDQGTILSKQCVGTIVRQAK